MVRSVKMGLGAAYHKAGWAGCWCKHCRVRGRGRRKQRRSLHKLARREARRLTREESLE